MIFLTLCVNRWFKQYENIVKLNMQAILNASAMHDEFVKEFLVSHGKVIVAFYIQSFMNSVGCVIRQI